MREPVRAEVREVRPRADLSFWSGSCRPATSMLPRHPFPGVGAVTGSRPGSRPSPSLALGSMLVLLFSLSPGLLAEESAEPAADLAPRFQRWLEEVDLLLSEEEREVFSELEEDYQRDGFIERFWEARDPYPRTTRNEFRDDWEQRVAYARQHFADLDRDARSPTLLLGGEPDVRLEAPCPTLFRRDLEMWLYAENDQLAREHGIVFLGGGPDKPFREWEPTPSDVAEDRSLLEIVRDSVGDLRSGCRVVDGQLGITERQRRRERELIPGVQLVRQENELLACVLEHVDRSCPEAEQPYVLLTLMAAYRGGLTFGTLDAQGGRLLRHHTRRARLQRPAPRSQEWLADFRVLGTEIPEGAASLPVTLRTVFAPAEGPRTTLRGVVEVDAAVAVVGDVDGHRSRSFQLHGEILREGALHDGFRYRFDVPESVEGPLPLVFDRLLRPGTFEVRVRVEDLHGGAFGRAVRAVEVPPLDPGDAITSPDGELASDRAGLEAPPLRLVPPPGEQHTGMRRFDAEVTGVDPDEVEFFLDGRTMLRRKRPPYTVELDLGPVPRLHSVRAVARDGDGRLLGSDEIELNLGPHRFGVALQEPLVEPAAGTVTVRAQVQVPEGERLDRLEILVDGEPRGVLHEPPWSLTLPNPGQRVQVVEARGFLATGLEAGDTVLLGGTGVGERIDVRVVEVWTSLLDGDRRPVHGISKDEVRVLEDGASQELLRFEEARDLPLSALMVLDTSTSMAERLDQVRSGALSFLGSVVGPKDRVALATFSSRPSLAIELTRDLEPFAERVATLRAEGSTALWDAIVFGLSYFNGVQGQRAIVLLTDGDDESSRHSFAEARLHAESAGVAIYPVGLSIPKSSVEIRFRLDRLAEATGGRVFHVDDPPELPGVYAAIESEARSKYLLAYQSEGTGDEFRKVEVETDRPGIVVEAMRGYFP